MADVVWGLATSHVPSIGAALDRGKTGSEEWKPLFDGYRPAQEWMAQNRPDIAVVVYNDHANALGPDMMPTFGLGMADRYEVLDEGFGRRSVPDAAGAPKLSEHLLHSLVSEDFDMTAFHRLDVDHGLTVPLSVYCPQPGEAWPVQVVPLLVNVIQYPQPSAARCYALGKALGRAIRSYPGSARVAVFGTGGMSHQLTGERAGLINSKFDHDFLDAIESDPEALAALSHEHYIREAGSEGLELIMWLVMRGALNARVRRVHRTYHVPASNTAAALALFDNQATEA